MRHLPFHKLAWNLSLTLALVGLLCTGCGTKPESVESAELRSNMRSLAVAYGNYTKENRGRVPKSEKTFRKWIEKQGPQFLEVVGVDTVDEIFNSSRDNEPYEVVYGKQKEIVAYEKVGVDGKRYVIDNLGIHKEVDEASFQELVPDAK